MSDDDNKLHNSDGLRSLTDDEIVTERKVPRRSFLSASGTVLAGVAGIVSGARAAGQDDPDKRPDDKRKPDDKPKPDDKRKAEERRRTDDKPKPDYRRRTDDRPKPDDKPRPGDTPKPDDPHA